MSKIETLFLGTNALRPTVGNDVASLLINGKYQVDTGWYSAANMLNYGHSVFDVEYDGTTLKKDLIQGRDTNDYDEKIISIIKDAYEECWYEIDTGCQYCPVYFSEIFRTICNN